MKSLPSGLYYRTYKFPATVAAASSLSKSQLNSKGVESAADSSSQPPTTTNFATTPSNPIGGNSTFPPSITPLSKWKKNSRSGGSGPFEDNRLLPPSQTTSLFNLNPRKIKRYLDEYVIGQDDLKVTLSVALYNHYQRLEINKEADVKIDKSNVLLFGPSGSGKTLTAKTIASLLNVPFTMNDATSFTQAGYVGDDVESCISRLLVACDYNVEQAERGIVFIDEIDKIARRSDQSNPNQRDVSGEGVQQGLLRMLEGTTVHVSVKPGTVIGSRLAQPGESFSVDTSNILFICSGAFIGLNKIIHERMNQKGNIGFGDIQESSSFAFSSPDHSPTNLGCVEPEDVIKYGFIPEFIGRMPVFVSSEPLSRKQLADILTQPRNALIKQYKALFKKSKIDLTFTTEAIDEIAAVAHSKNTGARGLRRIMENLVEKPLYNYADSNVKKIEITRESLKKEAKASSS